MRKHLSSMMQLTKRRAAFGLRQLMDEFRLLQWAPAFRISTTPSTLTNCRSRSSFGGTPG